MVYGGVSPKVLSPGTQVTSPEILETAEGTDPSKHPPGVFTSVNPSVLKCHYKCDLIQIFSTNTNYVYLIQRTI